MFYVEIEALNETYIRINSNNEAIFEVLFDTFSFEVPSARFMKSHIRNGGSWDGFIRLFNYRERTIPKGLGKEIVKILKSADYGEVRFVGFEKKPDISDDFEDIYQEIYDQIQGTDNPFDPYDFQIETVKKACQNQRNLIISPTSSGKSLMIYIWYRFVRTVLQEDEKILIIVPSITLVDQLFDDFKSYGYTGDAHLIVGGSAKDADCNLYISTWQSLQKLQPKWFRKFKGVAVDEVHGAAAASLKGSVEKCINATFRAGFTGTLNELETDELVLRGLFGDVLVATTYQEMRERGIIPDVEIELVRVKYGENFKDLIKASHNEFSQEMAFVQSNKQRDEVLLNILRENSGLNGIFLFREIKHLKRIEELFRKNTNQTIAVINGAVDRNTRAEIRKSIDANAAKGIRGCIILATYGTMSTGVSIKNLDYGVFAAPMKSKIKVLQSLGRLLRKSSSKFYAKLYDVWDDFLPHVKEDNFGKKHAKSRLRFYQEAGFRLVERAVSVGDTERVQGLDC
ncbi:ATP-dependent RNA-DNA and DNA-DNA helicase protein [Rhizobium phage RHph_I46]|uniref:ATP-dependent RNA-DNA and DNA-DNA helicase protein n=1 Tax=Rhizobium phage RHph_I1_9 TaxID=2509729 RepID=A0A7S5R9B1_9CAUD|nr:ATP-dependent RNA-DNA and DNA-DNA helicase protein [Rhizobium phage RHph_I1_9]QIG69629.1 ATP-dependent RNA-DNA and DNA-DNA helicase protein [Rhizobium phage RHph_I46]QIG70910.1 ATP-dependent RNA-DNA and DNA-DNA helicase protein [Rhizobium phage RHph_I9]QIG73496.1 ATP-dependent RNA-DNA and DNA-DNA helicase protein [Rhizobium phage RHph_I1_9]QIG76249.1 ATP-dependent RNA-DNA and DNA-DNA helicase protein [Rhizobium phage RHph_I34]